jgi:cell volume regulation protein A
MDYGEASAEMFLLLTFVAFGASVIWTGFQAADAPTLVFAVLALGVRTAVLIPVLRLGGVEPRSRRLIAWLGPRGLSTLLLALLPMFAGVEGSVRLFQITCLVVLLSVVVHGAGIAIFLRRTRSDSPSPPAVREKAPGPLTFGHASSEAEAAPVPEKITIEDLRELQERGEPVTVLDVRTERSYRESHAIGRDAIRMPPDDAVRLARERRLDPNATLVLYCT